MKSFTKRVFYRDVFILLPRNMTRLVEDKKDIYKIVKEETESSRIQTDKLFEKCDSERNSVVNTEPLNILMMMIDSVSHNQAKRYLPLTYDYLKSWDKDNLIFENYMLMGENTKPNLLPLISGNLIFKFYLSNEDPERNYHRSPLFWRDFENLGYISMFNEDFLKHGKNINSNFVNKAVITLNLYR